MRISSLLVVPSLIFSQTATTQSPRAFPITNYMVDLNDSIKIVQILLGEETTIAEKQVGLLKGRYRDQKSDTATIGIGRCNLIKGTYYYFTINYQQSGVIPREGDLLYTMVNKTGTYEGRLTKLAANYIVIQDVYDSPWLDRYSIFTNWSVEQERSALDSMMRDIRFTADYYLKNSPSMNLKISSGRYDGKLVFNAMLEGTLTDLTDFIDYMNARPRLYAGNKWKISEVFATWLTSGAPTPVKGN